ncbi:uncharacterized protein LOC131885385 isoform X2 [Tigriopus californicus]|uniref:uncharacterized protein LOC131885385 isoform X2 n=1 Tax=Tigriopus californicus TaxID=6832 RepID=UPI0027DAAE0E|nr:uncharacterized protein LOC131885385 isoform X2 [Tigriopus californicus]
MKSTQGMYPKLTSQDGIAGKGKMTSASRGSRCMQKVIMEDAIEYQERLQCTMVSEQSCSITFKTVFKAKTVNECQEYFKKTCIIEFEPVVHYKRVQFCRDFPIHQCSQSNQIEGGSGNDTCIEDHVEFCMIEEPEPFASCPRHIHDQCSTSKNSPTSESVCLRNHLKLGNCQLKKRSSHASPRLNHKMISPRCRKVPQHICLSDSCSRAQKRTCKFRLKKIVIDVPQETCTLLPLERCGPATKVLPSLQAQEHCINTPKEICQPASLMPKRRIKLPRVRRWCEDRRA